MVGKAAGKRPLDRTLVGALALVAAVAVILVVVLAGTEGRGHGGAGLHLERLDGSDGVNRETPTLSDADVEALPDKVVAALEEAFDSGESHVAISERQYDRVRAAFNEDAQQESPRTIVYRGVAFAFVFLME